MAKAFYLPHAAKDETIELPVASILLRHAQGNVLFDTGCHPDISAGSVARLGKLGKLITPIAPAGENVLTGLKGLGLAASDIDVVICSHLHFDHCGCNQFFGRATQIVHRLELDAARAGAASIYSGYMSDDWDHPLNFDAIDGQRDLFGDGRIVLLPLPGHTPGSVGRARRARPQRAIPAGVRHGRGAGGVRSRLRAGQFVGQGGPARRATRRCGGSRPAALP